MTCSAATACTAVGYYVNSSSTDLTLAERWNGSSWATESTPNPTGSTRSVLAGVKCTAASSCAAVGFYVNSSGTFLTLAEGWNGVSWAVQLTPNHSGTTWNILRAMSCTAATACTAVGNYRIGSGTALTLAERYS